MTSDGEWMAAQIQTAPSMRIVERQVLFSLGDEYRVGAGGGFVSVSADDQRFLMMRYVSEDVAEEGDAPRYILVYNWFEELKEKVGR